MVPTMPRRSRKSPLPERLRRLAAAIEAGEFPPIVLPDVTETLVEWEGYVASFAYDPGAYSDDLPTLIDGQHPIRVWCDGSCSPNPGAGGWGAIIEMDGRRQEISGASADTTNNIMEMTAAIEALKRTPQTARLAVTTDSQYVIMGITRWLPGWKRKGWRKADGQPVLNQGLWIALDELNQSREVTWVWVRGHTGHRENERCDELANHARRRLNRRQ